MRFFLILRGLIVLSALFIYPRALAQRDNIVTNKKTIDGRYNLLKFDKLKQRGLSNVPAIIQVKEIFGLGGKHSFVQQLIPNEDNSLRSDLPGITHLRYNQYFNNVKVEYGVVTLHMKNAGPDMATGAYFNIKENFSTTPVISENAALNKAIAFIGAKKYSWQDASFTNSVLKDVPKGELVICQNFKKQFNNSSIPEMELAYKFAIYATEPLRYEYVYISAGTGNVLLDNPIIKHASGTGATRYSGSRTIGTTRLPGGNFVLKDSGTNYNIATYNLNRGSNYSTAANFSDSDNNWQAAEFNNSNYDNAAIDAHWGAMMTLDYWRTAHNRNSFDNKGARINSYVHYGNLYANAFWDGLQMTYGDGDGAAMSPLTSVDICGHEIGHAVCANTANLIYFNESGALNEGFSDIWGACIKNYADPSKNIWLTGDEISGTGTPIRSLKDPKSKGQPDTYKGVNWFTGSWDNGGVHYNSGIINHWFYLLTEGKSGANDNGTTYKVKGIGITKAAQIAYRAESIYLYPSAVYADARLYTIQAAEDLFGVGSDESIQTTEAWKAVGVNEILAKPDSVLAVISENKVIVNWKFNKFQSVDGFKIERAINGNNQYITIDTTGPNTRSLTDSGYSNNSINQYRIQSFKGTSTSDYSEIASVAIGNAPIIMMNGSFTTCGSTFFDPGGTGNYSNGYYLTTVRPAISGNNLKIIFSQFNLNYSDYLYIYDGPSASSPLLGRYYSANMPPVLQSTAPGGELTFAFNSYNLNGLSGWQAYINCFKPVTAPSNLKAYADSNKDVHLAWTDNANDETHYIVERSLNDSLHYLPLLILYANKTNYIDTSAIPDTYVYYRVRAYRDSVASSYSKSALVVNGNIFLMENQPLITCGITFLDPGGKGNYAYGYYTTRVSPAKIGNNVKVVFSEFNVYYDNLYVYDGTTVSSATLLGVYTGATLPPALQSSAPGGELTFVFNAYNLNAPGWKAYISCFKPVLKPTGLKAISDTSRFIKLTWKDNANDETRYVVERSINTPSKYTPIVQLKFNANKYTDSTAPLNSLLYYRVRAYRDTLGSVYSDTTVEAFGNAPFIMKDSALITCDKVFMDPAGVDLIPPNADYNIVSTFKPAIAGNNVKVVFSKFRLNGTLYVYNGPSKVSPLIGSFSGYYPSLSFDGNGTDGSLTFYYNGYSYGDSGWVAKVSCYKPVLRPTGLTAIADTSRLIKLAWKDNANDETRYVVERSVNAPSKYTLLAQLKPNTNKYTDNTAPGNSLLYYRVRAYRDTMASFYSDTAILALGNAPFLMKDSTLITCDRVVMDPAGTDVLPSNIYYNSITTFKPAVTGNNVKVVFSKFRSEVMLYVYNGPSRNSPLIGSYHGYYPSLSFEGTGADGSLTFYINGYSNKDSGWVAKVSCYKPVLKPTGLTAISDTSQLIKLTWKDNASDETRYVVERSVNAPSRYAAIIQLKSDATKYTDSTAPANSLLYYRIRAYRDTAGSFYSDTARISLGHVPFFMKDSTLITCNNIFIGPMAPGVKSPDTYYNTIATFKPAIAGNNIKVVFSKFKAKGSLRVFNGPSTSSPFVGSFSGSRSSLSFNGDGADGSLTFYYAGFTYGDSSWVAQVSCYKPVLKPTGLNAISGTSRFIKLTWKDNADDEKKYIVERSVNAPSMYKQIAQLISNTNKYTDTTAPANSLLFYRVRAYRDTTKSFYSDTALIALGNAPFLMKDSTLITCDKVFMDPAGAGVIPFDTYHYSIATFNPAITGNNIKVVFSKFRLNGTLYVRNGPSQNSPLIGAYSGYYPSLSFEGDGATGSLTFNYYGYANGDSGWVAKVSCYKPVLKPTVLTAISDTSRFIKLTWKDNAGDEARYIVERSVNAPSMYKQIAQLRSNANKYTDSTAPGNSLLYYRVRAYRDTLASFYSDTAMVAFGNAPFLMKDSTLLTCDKVFMDPGGLDVVPSDIYYRSLTTFKAPVAGNNVKVVFTKFRLNFHLYVYNGPSRTSARIGEYYGYYPALSFEGTGTDGSLTFYYEGYGDSGWVAKVSCYKPVLKPTGLKAISDSSQLIKLTWKDNAKDETRYVVERSVNAPSKFTSLVQLGPNSKTYTDNTAPANSVMYYRIRAYRDTASSFYSNVVIIALGNAPFLMNDSTLITCDKVFMDPAGVDVISADIFVNDYDNYRRATFKPAIAGNKIRVVFSKFMSNNNLTVYNGASIYSPRIGNYSGNYSSLSFDATGETGSLTFEYPRSRGLSFTDSGWVAQVSCYKPVSAPGGLWGKADTSKHLVKLNWNDNADDETRYVVLRSVNSLSKYTLIAQLPSNTNKYTDSTAPANSLLYYKVKAYRDTLESLYSSAARVTFGNAPFFMKDSTLITCDKEFFGPSSINRVPSANYYNTVATFKPAQTGNSIKVIFNKFDMDGSLNVYNGSSITSPLIGSYYGYYPSLSFQATGTDGSLTFFYSGFSHLDSGWVAQVSCIKTIDTIPGFAVNNNPDNASSLVRGTKYKWQEHKGSQFAAIAKLGQNSPNPFNRKSIIPYSIPASSKAATLVIHTIDGKAIKVFSNLSKGLNSIEILANTFAPGVYTYLLLVDGKRVQTRKMIIIK